MSETVLEQNETVLEQNETALEQNETEVVTETTDDIKKKVKERKKQDKDKELEYIKSTTDLMKEIRMKAGYNQPELSKETGMIQQMVSRIDTNIINPRLSSVKKYLEACGIDLDALLSDALQNMEEKRY